MTAFAAELERIPREVFIRRVVEMDGYGYVDRIVVYRGLAREFCIPETDLPRREILTDGPMFGTPVYRWLPPKAKIESHFLLFYASCL